MAWMQHLLNNAAFSYINGGHQSSSAVANVLEFFAFAPSLAVGGALLCSSQGLDTGFFIHTDNVVPGVKPLNTFQNQVAHKCYPNGECLPILNLGEQPVFIFMRPQLIFFKIVPKYRGDIVWTMPWAMATLASISCVQSVISIP